MSYSVKIICDSISETGKRLTTFEVTFPRIVLAEFNTHRMFSRNSASSRAIPVEKQIERVLENPFIPEKFPANYKGMQPNEYWEKGDYKYKLAEREWLGARDEMIARVRALTAESSNGIKVHKQIANRLLEPFMWHTVIVTATEYDNFFKLRTNEQAQYEIRRIADLMYELYHNNTLYNEARPHKDGGMIMNGPGERIYPKQLKVGEWHLPFISEEDRELIDDFWNRLPENTEYKTTLCIEKAVSVARCARVSYLTHDGKRDIEKDLELFERLRTSGHWSPFEHVATPYFDSNYKKYNKGLLNRSPLADESGNYRSGNFIGWKQFRKEFQDENCTHFRKEN